jgi:plastocyanin
MVPTAVPVLRRPATVAAAALGVLTLLYLVWALLLGAEPRWDLAVFALLPAGAAGLTLAGGRWAAPVPAVLAVAILSYVGAEAAFNLARPGDAGPFVWTLALLGVLGIALAASIFVAVGRRTAHPAALAAGSVVLGAGLAAAVLVAGPQPALEDDYSPAELAALPRVQAQDTRFAPARLTARAGRPVELVLVNTGAAPHDLVIDDLGVDRVVPSGRSTVVRFTPRTAGSYLYYCSVGDHLERGMAGRLEVR